MPLTTASRDGTLCFVPATMKLRLILGALLCLNLAIFTGRELLS
jgi:hypothetical protein